MGHKIDEIQLQMMGMSLRNISALREMEAVTIGAVLDTTEFEKYLFSISKDDLKQDIEKVRQLFFLRPSEKCDESILLLTVLNSIVSRLDSIEVKINELDKTKWLSIYQ